MTIEIIPVFCNDSNMANYAYIIKEAQSSECIIIDAAETRPIADKLQQLHLTPTHILTTHHHFDHVGGNLELKEQYHAAVVAPKDEFDFVPGADIAASEDEPLKIADLEFNIIKAPGHTLGHILYYLKSADALFTGDTLFNLNIGGLFEGTPEQMLTSLNKIKELPDNTLIFPGHEYTRGGLTQKLLANPKFAPYLAKMKSREEGKLAPATLQEEKLFNPYLNGSFF